VVGTAEQPEDGASVALGELQGRVLLVPRVADDTSVETNHSGEPVPSSRQVERVPPTEAEANGEDDCRTSARGRPQVCDRSSGIHGDGVVSRLVDVRPMIEVGRSRPHAGRPPKVVDRARMDSCLGEPQGKLAVEEMEPADVGQHDDAWPAFMAGQCMMCAEEIAVLGRKDEPTLSDHIASAGDRRQRWSSLAPVAHACVPVD
jgi:hypothetical protein